ncbi:hypothetical protein [Polluticaenibacter yanchengensis]|uniref:Outer membrane lipoprotein-sorting protein n=1 Tax=Polluticaenibacter yanchengensis TaxID=3014562 RepID=A0ABT4UPR6_9BACT|nr:hypothetical protein [Chitinophagaceae bacterium LY-5]
MRYSNITNKLLLFSFICLLKSLDVYAGKKKLKDGVKVDFEQIFQRWHQPSLDVQIRYEYLSSTDTIETDCSYMYRGKSLYMKTDQYEQLSDDSLVILIDHDLKQVSIERAVASDTVSRTGLLSSYSKQLAGDLKQYSQEVSESGNQTIYIFSSKDYAYAKQIPREQVFYHYNKDRSEITLVEYMKNTVLKVDTKIHPEAADTAHPGYRILSKEGDWVWLHIEERQRLVYSYRESVTGALPLSRALVLKSGENGPELTERFKDYVLISN